MYRREKVEMANKVTSMLKNRLLAIANSAAWEKINERESGSKVGKRDR